MIISCRTRMDQRSLVFQTVKIQCCSCLSSISRVRYSLEIVRRGWQSESWRTESIGMTKLLHIALGDHTKRRTAAIQKKECGRRSHFSHSGAGNGRSRKIMRYIILQRSIQNFDNVLRKKDREQLNQWYMGITKEKISGKAFSVVKLWQRWQSRAH